MRYTEFLTESSSKDKIIPYLENDQNFKNWFKGSKVVDINNKPQIVFHYSNSEQYFDKFKAFSHFGTDIAAEERFEYFYDEEDDFTQTGFTVPCFLNIKKPMFIEDFQSSSNMLAYDLYNSGLINFDELYKVSTKEFQKLLLEDSVEGKEYLADFDDNKLVKVLSDKGYDGFCYINEVEDKGSMSWIIFKSNQVWKLFSNKED